jgi:geranylgeranyl pyrophosphate synthase
MSLKNHEILSLEETLKVFEYKTSTAFKVSLLLGAIAGGADKTTLSSLEEFSRAVGIAYQIKDDLDDFSHPGEKFEIYKPSVLISMLAGQISESEKHIFGKALTGKDFDPIKQMIDKYGIRQSAEDLLKGYIKESDDCLGTFQNIGLKMALHEILGNTFKEYI